MTIKSTSSFQKDIDNLTEREKYGYSSIRLDIRKHFANINFESFLNNSLNLYDNPDFRLFKIRLPNSGQNIGKSGGFRLICIADKTNKIAVLLHVYPKKGKMGKEDIDDKHINLLLEDYDRQKNELLDWVEPQEPAV